MWWWSTKSIKPERWAGHCREDTHWVLYWNLGYLERWNDINPRTIVACLRLSRPSDEALDNRYALTSRCKRSWSSPCDWEWRASKVQLTTLGNRGREERRVSIILRQEALPAYVHDAFDFDQVVMIPFPRLPPGVLPVCMWLSRWAVQDVGLATVSSFSSCGFVIQRFLISYDIHNRKNQALLVGICIYS